MLRFELGPSRALTGILILVHGISIFLIGFSSLPWWIAAFLISLVIVSCFRSVRIHGLKTHPAAIRALWAKEEGNWELFSADGVSYEARLLAGSYVSPYLTVLNFRVPGRLKGINVVILPDEIEPEAFRQLRVWLKWGSPFQSTSQNTNADLLGH